MESRQWRAGYIRRLPKSFHLISSGNQRVFSGARKRQCSTAGAILPAVPCDFAPQPGLSSFRLPARPSSRRWFSGCPTLCAFLQRVGILLRLPTNRHPEFRLVLSPSWQSKGRSSTGACRLRPGRRCRTSAFLVVGTCRCSVGIFARASSAPRARVCRETQAPPARLLDPLCAAAVRLLPRCPPSCSRCPLCLVPSVAMAPDRPARRRLSSEICFLPPSARISHPAEKNVR